ncbi:MAG: hypothetical protein GY799_14735 [Desulfobulbaceae bacterium]|nr:hypothetical protein [Desulfobulbaceae bacterium]
MKKLRLLSISFIVLLVVCSGAFAGEGYGPGRIVLKIFAGRDHVDVGSGGIWNSRDKLHIQLDPADGWRIKGYHVDLGGEADYLPPLTTTGNPQIGHFDYKDVFSSPYTNEVNVDGYPYRRTLVLDLGEDLGFQWGSPWADLRIQGVAIFISLVKVDEQGKVISETGAWAVPELVVWAVEGDAESIAEEAIVADASSGEVVSAEVTEVKWVGKGNKVAKIQHQKAKKSWVVEELEEVVSFDGGRWGWWFRYEMAHPRTGHFIDSPVAGLSVETPTYEGVTGVNAAFDYFPGEKVDVSIGSVLLGSAVADHKISPLDIFPMADTEYMKVLNMGRLLQSLDVDGDPQGGINITPAVVDAFEQTMSDQSLTEIDFTDDDQVQAIILDTVIYASQQEPPVLLTMQSIEDAKAHLDESLNNSMFRKNISKTADLASAKAKMNIMTVWMPAMAANGELASFVSADDTVQDGILYYDEEGSFIRAATKAKPIIVTYTDADPTTGAPDVWAAISRDDGTTWKRKNLSRSGDLSSFTLENGQPYYGATKKPVFQVKGNKILVAWSSKFAKGGKPRYAIKADNPLTEDIDESDDYEYDDPYYTEDIWGVGGPQRSHDYVEDGFPEVGEVPYSALWVCRGIIATQTDIDNGVGEFIGDIVWFKPERVTSGRRDVNQIFCGAASGAGFGLVWQEDPKGLRPGKAVGPGPGWGGATTNHKTDIWYSYIGWGDHTKVDDEFVSGGDPDHDLDFVERPKALVPMSLPVRLSDNDVLNQKNMGVDLTAPHANLSFGEEHLTRCVKFEEALTIVEPDYVYEPGEEAADYSTLRAVPSDHHSTMNCTNCHVPYGLTPKIMYDQETETDLEVPTQGAPIPLVVKRNEDDDIDDYLGGFTNGDCVSCHYSHIVPRDRVVDVTPGLDEEAKADECVGKEGIWKDGTQEDGKIVEAYYPYEGYPYIKNEDDINDGTHRYGLAVDGLLDGEYYKFTNYSGTETSVAITTDGRLMDGDTGASRGNLFLQPYKNAAGKTSAWAIITYEETKGAGSGPPEDTGEGISHSDDYIPESGKNIIYHSFDFKDPDLVSGGNIINQPEMSGEVPVYLRYADESGEPNGNQILDYLGRPQLAYENARRGRFILQGAGAVKSSGTIMLMVYKQGEEGAGRPSDIMMRRWVVSTDDPNPYCFENIVGDWLYDSSSEQYYWDSGPVNMSSVTPLATTDSAGDPEKDDAYGAVKVVTWQQTVENQDDSSSKNPYDDARAHRGQIRGDFVQLGFSYTPNWAAARNGNDKYDFYIRRSFDGGATWTTDPNGGGVTHCYNWKYPDAYGDAALAGEKIEECNTYARGAFESMRNLSQLPNAKTSVIEPRIVAVPGTIKAGGDWTGIAEDKQKPNVFYVAWGTSTNPKKDLETGEQEEPVPMDLYWTFSQNKGESYHEDEWVVNPDSDGSNAGETLNGYGWMAKGDQEQGEVQLRMTPDGSRFYGSWLDEGEEGSDIVFRRIMSADFDVNNADGTAPVASNDDLEEAMTVLAEEAGSDDDFSSDSGGDED